MEPYLLLALLAMAGYGITAILYKLAGRSTDPVTTTLIASVFMTAVILIFWLLSRNKKYNLESLKYAGIAGIIAGLSFISFIAAIQMGKASIAATLRGLSFAVTALVAVLFLAEKLTLLKVVGIGFAVIAILLLTL